MRVRWKEAGIIEQELLDEFARTKEYSFKYEREFKNQSNIPYLRVKVAGTKDRMPWGYCGQYTVKIEYIGGKIELEVKRSQAYTHSDASRPVEIVSFLNKVLFILDIIKACTVIPSDCGQIDTLEIIFDNIDGMWDDKVVKIPLR